MTTIWYILHTKNWSLETTDLNKVNACIASGVVPRLYLRNDGYLRQGYCALTYIEIMSVTGEKASEPVVFYRTTK